MLKDNSKTWVKHNLKKHKLGHLKDVGGIFQVYTGSTKNRNFQGKHHLNNLAVADHMTFRFSSFFHATLKFEETT